MQVWWGKGRTEIKATVALMHALVPKRVGGSNSFTIYVIMHNHITPQQHFLLRVQLWPIMPVCEAVVWPTMRWKNSGSLEVARFFSRIYMERGLKISRWGRAWEKKNPLTPKESSKTKVDSFLVILAWKKASWYSFKTQMLSELK